MPQLLIQRVNFADTDSIRQQRPLYRCAITTVISLVVFQAIIISCSRSSWFRLPLHVAAPGSMRSIVWELTVVAMLDKRVLVPKLQGTASEFYRLVCIFLVPNSFLCFCKANTTGQMCFNYCDNPTALLSFFKIVFRRLLNYPRNSGMERCNVNFPHIFGQKYTSVHKKTPFRRHVYKMLTKLDYIRNSFDNSNAADVCTVNFSTHTPWRGYGKLTNVNISNVWKYFPPRSSPMVCIAFEHRDEGTSFFHW